MSDGIKWKHLNASVREHLNTFPSESMKFSFVVFTVLFIDFWVYYHAFTKNLLIGNGDDDLNEFRDCTMIMISINR